MSAAVEITRTDHLPVELRAFAARSDACLLRLAAGTVGRTDTALGAFYRRLSARAGKAKAITATARKIAGLFYNALRHGMSYADPGANLLRRTLSAAGPAKSATAGEVARVRPDRRAA